MRAQLRGRLHQRARIQSVGSAEETHCRFCHDTLPDWSLSLLPEHTRANAPTAVMAVVYNSRVVKVPVKRLVYLPSPALLTGLPWVLCVVQGPDGEAEFKAAVKCLFGFAHDMEFDVTFEVKLPSVPGYSLPATGTNSSLMLHGLGQFGAAATCAQASAVARAMAGGEAGLPQ
ncbi:hypothetical protein V8C86DRAFT_3099081 [Haematococcus lacustris]